LPKTITSVLTLKILKKVMIVMRVLPKNPRIKKSRKRSPCLFKERNKIKKGE